MWPSTLDMTRDECRGILRRLELESYSSVISTFRAQGGLSETKVKLLEELRNVFHISQDRHRAEARRVANDEQLCTIAETISGPNTAQEWCREGRRSFPLLPRAAAYTALSVVANGVADKVTIENSKLPYPSETVRSSKSNSQEQNQTEEESSKDIVLEDPLQAALEEKKNLKRTLSLLDHVALTVPTAKKRTVSGGSTHSQSQAPVHTNTRIQQLYHSHSKTQSRHKKSTSKRNASVAKTKSNAAPSKVIAQRQAKSAEMSIPNNKTNLLSPRTLHTYASAPQHMCTVESTLVSGENIIKGAVTEIEASISNKWPQIATSKKDITNNLSKLNLPSTSSNQQHHMQQQLLQQQQQQQQPILIQQQQQLQQPQPSSTTEGISKNDKLIMLPQKLSDDSRNLIKSMDASSVSWTTKLNSPSLPGQRCNIKSSSAISGAKAIKLQQIPLQSMSSHGVISAVADSSQLVLSGNRQIVSPTTTTTVNINHRNEKDLTIATGKILSTDTSLPPKLDITAASGEVKRISTAAICPTFTQKQILCKTATQVIPPKPKIQITNQQIISPPGGGLRFSPGVHLKGIQGRKSVKIFSSSGGKMFIQSADNTKSIAKIGAVVTQKNLLSALPATVAQATASGNRISVQKVQLLSSPVNKQLSIGKSNMVLMQTINNSGQSPGNVVLRTLPLAKNNNKDIQQQQQLTQDNDKILNDTIPYTSLGKTQNNVIVIGTVASNEKDIKNVEHLNKNLSENNMITEDTPVDILTTPISSLDSNALSLSQVSGVKDTETYEVKSTPTVAVVQTLPTVNITKKFQLRKDNMTCVTKEVQIHSGSNTNDGNFITTSLNTENTNYIINPTDWEVELDQEANKTRGKVERNIVIRDNSKSQNKRNVSESGSDTGKDMNTSIIDNFHDVIEEDAVDDDLVGNENTEEEDEVEFDVTYEAQEDLEENATIEYVEEAVTSSDEMIEIYGEQINKNEPDLNHKNRTNIISIARHMKSDENNSFNIDIDNQRKKFISNNKIRRARYLESSAASANGKNKEAAKNINTAMGSAVMFEMHDIDEKSGISQVRNVTVEEFLTLDKTQAESADKTQCAESSSK